MHGILEKFVQLLFVNEYIWVIKLELIKNERQVYLNCDDRVSRVFDELAIYKPRVPRGHHYDIGQRVRFYDRK